MPYNFYSGPSMLPEGIIEAAKAAMDNFAGTGLSLLEISHRAKPFVAVMDAARERARQLMGLSADYEVLFLQGGASTQFYMIPYNLLEPGETAGYIDTGTWAHGALEEARLFGSVQVLASSKDANYTFIPKTIAAITAPLKYVHITTNNTIYGTQWPVAALQQLRASLPKETLMVADMSSDIFSRAIDYSMFDVIYAGAQKNMGIAGCTMVAVRKSVLTARRPLPKMVDYRVQIEQGSMKNTPSVFAVYVTHLVLEWIAKEGLEVIAQRNEEKAKLLYAAIDRSTQFKGTVQEEDRSAMNVCFRGNAEAAEARFSDLAKARGLVGLPGHRSVGGFRASIYNAMPLAGVQALAELIGEVG
ncbi:MAG: 3-phosphoserine/phosphohydroxythreonine transaminase [Chitinophagales bacterium]